MIEETPSPLLTWSKPPRTMSTEEWKAITADSAPAGVYTPNMSDEDAQRWKAKLVGKKGDSPRVEIRKKIRQTQMLLIISKELTFRSEYDKEGYNVRFTLNGPAEFTFKDWADFQKAVTQALAVLEALPKK